MMTRLPVYCFFAFMITACATGDPGPEQTIANLEEREAQLEPQVTFDINPQQVIESYHALAEITKDNPAYSGEVSRRLADLELDASLDNQDSADINIQQKGRQEALSAIAGYESYLKQFPNRDDNDLVLYQLSRAYAHEADTVKAQRTLDQLANNFPQSQYIDEVQFRRGESLFVNGDYAAAEQAYGVVVKQHRDSLFYEKALYKYGWSQLKQNNNLTAVDSFIQLLDLHESTGNIEENNFSNRLSRANQELLDDVVRVVSLGLSYEAENISVPAYFKRVGTRRYEPLLYRRLAERYQSKDRIADAADTFLEYGKQYPNSPYAPEFHQKTIDIYQKAGYNEQVLTQKTVFVNRFDVGSQFWNLQTQATKTALKPQLGIHLRELATHYHAQARISKKPKDFQISADWYRRYLKSFPNDPQAAEVNFLLAESLFDARQFNLAIIEYEKTAYQYPLHKNSAEAGYAALQTYDTLAKVASESMKKQIPKKRVDSALRFAGKFPNDKRASSVLLYSSEYFYAEENYPEAKKSAYRLIENKSTDRKTLMIAWTIVGHSHFSMQQYPEAETAYLKLLPYLPKKSKETSGIREQVAASIYKQGEIARADKNHLRAAQHFSRLGQVIPESPKRVVAEYDAATAYIELEDWPRSIVLLEKFRKDYARQKKWQTGVSEKLALAYNKNGNQAKAAGEMMLLSNSAPSSERKKELMWGAAELYQQAGKEKQAIGIYKSYVKLHPNPLDRSIELRHRIAEFYGAQKDQKSRNFWLGEIVKADARGKNQRNARSKYLAATASLELIKPTHAAFTKTRLTVPLKKSLKKKKSLMQQSITAYNNALKYQVAEVTTEATYQIAEIYHQFADALLSSQRPKGLNEEELEEYDLLLEEQAYPFEEKAIDIHLANFKRIPSGIYDKPVQASLKTLSELMPFRYARSEQTEAYVELP